MQIKQKTTYIFDGKEFGSTKEISSYIENSIGKIIDSIDVTFTPDQKLKIFASLEKNYKRISDLLGTKMEPDYCQLTGDYSFDEA